MAVCTRGADTKRVYKVNHVYTRGMRHIVGERAGRRNFYFHHLFVDAKDTHAFMHLACQAHFILSEGGTKPLRGVHYWIAYMNDLSSKALLSNCTELVV